MKSAGSVGNLSTSPAAAELGNRLDSNSLESRLALYMAVSLMAIIILVGCTGNLMVILAVRTTRKLQIVSNAFVVNLSVCDLLFVMVILPFNIYTYITEGWSLPQGLCKAIGFLGYTLTGTTIITITLIAWNRYKLVVDLPDYRRMFSPMRIGLMLTLAWLLPMLCLLPALLEVWGRFGYVAMMVTCNLLLDHDSQSFKLFLLIVRAVVPCMLILYYYAHIFRTTRASHRRVRQGRLLLSSLGHLDQAIQRKEWHLTKMMATIFIVFALSYFPCTVSTIIDWNTVLSKRFHMFCLITVYLGSAVNPLIYGLMNSQFRFAYYNILLCQCCRHPSQEAPRKAATITATSPTTSCRIYTKGIIKKKKKKMMMGRGAIQATKLSSDQEDTTPFSSPEQGVHVFKKLSNEDGPSCPTPVSSPEQGLHFYRELHRTETEQTCMGDSDSEDINCDEPFKSAV